MAIGPDGSCGRCGSPTATAFAEPHRSRQVAPTTSTTIPPEGPRKADNTEASWVGPL